MIRITPSTVKRSRRTLLSACTLACYLVVLTGNHAVLASSYTITATVPAPIPTEAPVITSVINGQRVRTSNILIQGTCSSDTAYVELYRNNLFVGTGVCETESVDIPLTLVPDSNVIQAKATNSTGGEGPASPPITIYYDIPGTAPPPDTNPAADSGTISPFLLTSPTTPAEQPVSPPLLITADQSYTPRRPGELLSWLLTIHGGSSPYAVTIDWGDMRTTTKTTGVAALKLEHVYSQPGQYRIKVRATDSVGNSASLQLVAVVTGSPVEPPAKDPGSKLQHPMAAWVIPAAVVVTGAAAAPVIFGRRAVVQLLRTLFKR